MKARVVLPALTLAIVSAGLVWSADVGGNINGKWTAQVLGLDGHLSKSTLNFRVGGNNVTGSVSSGWDENPISDGKVRGKGISFVVMMYRGGDNWWVCPSPPSADGFHQVKTTYKGRLSGDEIKFMLTEDGSKQVQEFSAKRAK